MRRTALALASGLGGFCVIDDLLDLRHMRRLSGKRFLPTGVASGLATIQNFPSLVFTSHCSTTSEETAFSVAIITMFPIRPREWSFSPEAIHIPEAPINFLDCHVVPARLAISPATRGPT